MKKKFLIALSAVALMGLSACVEEQNVNPTFNPEKRTVNTQFVLNIAAADTPPQTKQSEENVQMTNNGQSGKLNNFRGIENATLFAFKVPKKGDKVMPIANSDDPDGWGNALTAIDLSSALTSTAIGDGGINESRRVMEIPIPLETNALIFYGMATKGDKNEAQRGSMSYIFPDYNIAHIGSYANARLAKDQITIFNALSDCIEAILNHMVRVGLGGASDAKASHPWDTTAIKNAKYKSGSVIWADYLCAVEADATGRLHSPMNNNQNPAPIETILGTAYQSFTTVKEGEARAGSGASLARELYDLYFIIVDCANGVPSSDEEAVAIELCNVLEDYILSFFDYQNRKWKNSETVWKAMGDKGYNFQPTTELQGLSATAYQDFPSQYNLPLGTAILNSKVQEIEGRNIRQFYYEDKPEAVEEIEDYTIADVTYTPELCYYGNSWLRVSESDNLTEKDFPDGTVDWSKWTLDSESSQKKWKDGPGEVTTSTRGVAMANNIQYGMALMSLTVEYEKKGSTIQLKDNLAALHPSTDPSQPSVDQTITLTDNTPLTLKGVLVGGQPCPVGWGYLPWTSYSGSTYPGAPTKFTWNKMVYDSDMSQPYFGSTTEKKIPLDAVSTPNYTILFDNYNDKDTKQNVVIISLEFVNRTGQDFWGKYNLIRNEGTFYVIAKLDPTQGSAVTWPDNYDEMMPPYDAAGKTIRTKRVFMQDFVTNVKVTLGEDVLKEALVSVPDLRAAKLSVGLSVDLSWKNGVNYTLNL